METPELKTKLNSIVPGVVEAYASLRTGHGTGLYTSSGSFYNHTFFARDSSMAAKFILDYDHALARETIVALAQMQGMERNDQTQEAPGRIHHELRDFTQWKGTLGERIVLWPFAKAWGMKDGKLLTYFAIDTTASYIRMTHKYATHIDRSILDQTYIARNGETLTIAQSLERAADWIVSQVDESGVFYSRRTNKWSLPFQTPQDSTTSYTRSDTTLMNYRSGISYVEAQVFAADALSDLVKLLVASPRIHVWREMVDRMQEAFFAQFWNTEDNYFASAIDIAGQTDLRNISVGWILNVSLWHTLPESVRADTISPLVSRLFSPEFLTPVGLRTRSVAQPQPLKGVIEYHGSNTVWPMFNFMVIEGLRRHNLYRLAEQIQNRTLNALNATGNFDEFFMVSAKGEVLRVADQHHASEWTIPVQMKPENNIAFSIVPALTMAHRISQQESHPPQEPWQSELEDRVLASMPYVDLASPEQALSTLGQVRYFTPRRLWGNVCTTKYFIEQSWRMK